MIITIGKYNGKSIEELLLKTPNYIIWMLGLEDPNGEMPFVIEEARKLIDIFDMKRFVDPCHGQGCSQPAIRCTVEPVSLRPTVWCNSCLEDGLPRTQSPWMGSYGRDL